MSDTNRETSDTTDRLTSTPQNRSADNEGYDAPRAKETGVAQHSVFDGAGNETVVVTTDNAETGRRKQGTGANAAEAMADSQDPDGVIGEGFGPPSGHA